MNPLPTETEAWNEAHQRLLAYLETFALADSRATARLALKLVDEARARADADPGRSPVTLALELAQGRLAAWLEEGVGVEDPASAQVAGPATLAVLLDGVPDRLPAAFLASPPSEEVRRALRQPLLVVGPDMEVSSMTPRRLDFGPMRGLANQTWHRWDSREVVVALLLWSTVFLVLYHWLPEWL